MVGDPPAFLARTPRTPEHSDHHTSGGARRMRAVRRQADHRHHSFQRREGEKKIDEHTSGINNATPKTRIQEWAGTSRRWTCPREGFSASWNVRIRFINRCQEPLSILELKGMEEGVGERQVHEISPVNGNRAELPIEVTTAAEYWIRSRAPHVQAQMPFTIGPLNIRVRPIVNHKVTSTLFPAEPLRHELSVKSRLEGHPRRRGRRLFREVRG